jgi:hypothetical protein
MNKFAEVRRAFADAQDRFAAYRAECVHFAAAFTRAVIEDFGWPRELVRYGDGSAEYPEDVMRLAADGCWELPMALQVREGEAVDTIAFQLRFRRAGDDWYLQLFPGVEFEVAAPTREALAPALDALHRALRAHYEQGLTHFLEGRSGRLHLPYTPADGGAVTRPAPSVRARATAPAA